MANTFVIQVKQWIKTCQVTVPNTSNGVSLSVLVAAALAAETPGDALPGHMTGYSISNNDVAAGIYVGYNSGVSATKFTDLVAATGKIEDNVERQVFAQLFVKSTAGSVLATVVIFGS